MSLDRSKIAMLERELDRQYVALLEEVREELAKSDESGMLERLERGGIDRGEEAVRDLLTDVNATLYHRHIGELRDIDEARRRMREGSYGFCIDCGEAIAFERLRAQPAAARCIGCQEQHDRIYAHRATPKM